jgi:uncharacterized protein YidB (DUF937 family)
MDDLAGMLNQLGGAQPADAGGGTATAANPAAAMAGLAGAIGSEGGLDSVLDKLRAAGYGDQVDSWISTGENKPIEPQALGAALGDDQVQKLSSSSGISITQLLPLLAAFLPTIVNMLTPKGETPPGGVNQAAANAGPDLGGLLGGLLGGAAGGGGAGCQGGVPDLGGLLGGMLGGGQQK